MEMVKKNERLFNFELMRIISMFMIVVWHVIMHSDLIGRSSGTLNFVLEFIYDIFSIHVNSFVLLSGYFQYNKKFNWRKLIPLINATWFYKALFAILFLSLGIVWISKIDFIMFLLPLNITANYKTFYWFINVYIVLYIISPFINILIKNLSQKEHRRLVIVLFVCLSILPYISKQMFVSNDGYSIASFVMLYIIGAYFGKYKISENVHFKNYSKEKRQFVLFGILIGIIILQLLTICLKRYFCEFDNGIFAYIRDVAGSGLSSFSSPVVIVESVVYLLLFETFYFKSKFINRVAGLTFGIYLVHENNFVFDFIYNFLPLGTTGKLSSLNVLIYLFVIGIGIFVVSAIIEFIRQILFKFINKIRLVKKFQNKCISYIEKF